MEHLRQKGKEKNIRNVVIHGLERTHVVAKQSPPRERQIRAASYDALGLETYMHLEE